VTDASEGRAAAAESGDVRDVRDDDERTNERRARSRDERAVARVIPHSLASYAARPRSIA
jgi:hypothetical protein